MLRGHLWNLGEYRTPVEQSQTGDTGEMERIIAIQKQAVDLRSGEDSGSPVANTKLGRRFL